MFFGRLDETALKHDWIEYMAGGSMFIGFIGIVILITYLKRWKWLWCDWLTSVDHKKIGIMYLIVSFIMLFKGLIDALMMRAQQAFACAEGLGYLEASHYQQIFTAHGVTMIFFVAMGVVFGLINLVLPLQIGARDVAFPVLNNISFWLFSASSLYILVSLVLGFFCRYRLVLLSPFSRIEVQSWSWSRLLALDRTNFWCRKSFIGH